MKDVKAFVSTPHDHCGVPIPETDGYGIYVGYMPEGGL